MSDARQALLDALTAERYGTGGVLDRPSAPREGPSRPLVHTALHIAALSGSTHDDEEGAA